MFNFDFKKLFIPFARIFQASAQNTVADGDGVHARDDDVSRQDKVVSCAGMFNYLSFGKTDGQPDQIIFLLHGYGRSAVFMEKVAEEISKKLPDALIIAPEGPEELEQIQEDSEFVLRVPVVLRNDDVDQSLRRQWFSIASADLTQYQAWMDEIATALNEFIDEHRDYYGLDDRNIGLMGFSQGGAVAMYTGLSRTTELGALVGHSAPFFPQDTALQSKPETYYIYGDDDEEFPVERYEKMRMALERYLGTLQTSVVAGLQHRTSRESRKLVADYFHQKMG